MSLPNSRFSSLHAIGALLREQREARHLTLHIVSHDTHIRVAYLDALEQGQPQQLPELVYVRGFLSRYADYLGLDGQALSQAWAELAGSPEPHPRRKRGWDPVIALRPLHLWGVYVGVVILTVSGLAYLVGGGESPLVRWWQAWRAWQTAALSPSDPEPTPETLPEPEAPLQGMAPELSPMPEPTGDPPTPVSVPTEQVLVAIRVVERPSWIRVIADNRTVLEDTLQPGTEMSWSAKDSIVLRAGNAGGVAVTWNNQPQGVLGNFGEVKEIVFSRASRDP